MEIIDQLQIIVCFQSPEIFSKTILDKEIIVTQKRSNKNARDGSLKNKSYQARLIPFFAITAGLLNGKKHQT